MIADGQVGSDSALSCKICSTQNPSDALFCGHCGAQIETTTAATKPERIGSQPLVRQAIDAPSDVSDHRRGERRWGSVKVIGGVFLGAGITLALVAGIPRLLILRHTAPVDSQGSAAIAPRFQDEKPLLPLDQQIGAPDTSARRTYLPEEGKITFTSDNDKNELQVEYPDGRRFVFLDFGLGDGSFTKVDDKAIGATSLDREDAFGDSGSPKGPQSVSISTDDLKDINGDGAPEVVGYGGLPTKYSRNPFTSVISLRKTGPVEIYSGYGEVKDIAHDGTVAVLDSIYVGGIGGGTLSEVSANTFEIPLYYSPGSVGICVPNTLAFRDYLGASWTNDKARLDDPQGTGLTKASEARSRDTALINLFLDVYLLGNRTGAYEYLEQLTPIPRDEDGMFDPNEDRPLYQLGLGLEKCCSSVLTEPEWKSLRSLHPEL